MSPFKEIFIFCVLEEGRFMSVIMNQPTIQNMLINPNHKYYVTIFKQALNRISEAMLEKP